MAEDTQKAQNTPESQESQLPGGEQQSGIEPNKENSEEGLPQEAKERTKREFERLTTSNKDLAEQLREERARREYYETILNTPKPQKQETQSIIDPDTGLPNEQVLTDVQARANDAQQRATRAEEQVQNILREQENRQVYVQHPELNPEDKSFDKNLHVMTRSIALQSMVKPEDFGNKQLSFMEAAKLAKEMRGQPNPQAVKEAVESMESKEQASLEAQGGSRRPVEDYDNLRRLSRRPGEEAQRARIERFNKITQGKP